MTTMAITESFDAQMMDFSGEDIPMQTSSSTSWIHPEATMDDDSSFHPGDVEIDMENYHPETFEYEMTDDSSTDQPIEVHDVEVVDVSQADTPALVDTVVEDAIIASPAVPEHDLTDTHDRSSLNTPPTLAIQAPSPTSQPTQDEEPKVTVTESFGQSEWEQGHSELPGITPSPHPAENHQPQNSAESVSLGGTTEPTLAWSVSPSMEQRPHPRLPTPDSLEQPQPQSVLEEPVEDLTNRWGEEDNPIPSRASSGDPHEVLDGIFIDPPPPVLLSLGDSEEEYYLFNRPALKSPAADDQEGIDDTLFLHDLPTLYYEPLAKVFEALRSDIRLTQLFDLSRGELVIDAYDLVDLVISEDNLYTNEVSFHDLNLLHDHADLAGPLRIRVGCNLPRFITRYRELKSKLEQFNLLEVNDAQLREQDDPTEQADADDVPEHPVQGETGDESPTSEEFDQETTEQQTGDAGSGAHVVDRFDEGKSSNETEPEWVQPGDEESTAAPLPGGEHTEQPDGVVEDDREEGTTTVTVPDSGHPGFVEDLDAAAAQEHSDVYDTPLGGNSTEYEEVVATNEDYDADYKEDDPDGEPGEAVAVEGDARDEGWETTAPDAQETRDGIEHHEVQRDTVGVDEHSDTIDLTAPTPDDGPIATQQDSDTDSIGRQTLDEFADAREESRDDRHPREGEGSNSNTDQSNEPIPDLDQFGDDFNWDEDFGGDFDDGEFGELEDQSNVGPQPVDPQQPISGGSKRGFDEIDSDTADEEQTPGDVSPNSKRKKVL